jgi:ABC-2 type transport system ATP-binding protein
MANPNTTPAVQILNLKKAYGSFNAVKDISFEVYPGEIFGILGINGAGKTTTLRMLAGVLKPTSGTISIGGFDLSKETIQAKQITGYIPDRPYLYNKLTGREFLYFVADLYNVPTDLTEQRIELLLSEYKLTQWQNELIESYSHGMRQRLATCAGLLHQPKVLIVDEPMVGLDPHGAKFLKQSFRKYAKEENMAILLSTHSLNVAEEVADRLIIIDHGTVIAYGTLDEIRNQTGRNDQGLEELFLQLTADADTAYSS